MQYLPSKKNSTNIKKKINKFCHFHDVYRHDIEEWHAFKKVDRKIDC
jgi:hypothetical protein